VKFDNFKHHKYDEILLECLQETLTDILGMLNNAKDQRDATGPSSPLNSSTDQRDATGPFSPLNSSMDQRDATGPDLL